MIATRVETALVVTLTLAVASLLAWLGLQGVLLPVLADTTLVTPGIAAAVVAGVLLSLWRYARLPATLDDAARLIEGIREWADFMPLLGLIGTTLGILQAFAAAGDHQTGQLLASVGWAMRNTVVGLVGLAWISLNARLCTVAAAKLLDERWGQ